MQTTRRIISPSAKTSKAYQQILADKQALRAQCASLNPVAGLLTNDYEAVQPLPIL